MKYHNLITYFNDFDAFSSTFFILKNLFHYYCFFCIFINERIAYDPDVLSMTTCIVFPETPLSHFNEMNS